MGHHHHDFYSLVGFELNFDAYQHLLHHHHRPYVVGCYYDELVEHDAFVDAVDVVVLDDDGDEDAWAYDSYVLDVPARCDDSWARAE